MDSFIAAFNSKDKAKVKTMMEAHFGPGMFERRKLEEWVAQTTQIATDLAPIKVEKNLLEKPEAIVFLAKAGNGETLAFRLDFEPQSPHRIIGIRIDQDPQSLLEPRKIVDYSGYRTLDELAQKIAANAKVPAMVIATWRDGKSEIGITGVQKMGTLDMASYHDRWLIGSIGKPMTSSLIATFIDEGKLNWDSKLGDVLTDIPMKDGYKAVTIEQLMQHMSGVPQDMNYTGATVTRIVGSLRDPVAIRASYVKDILSREPIEKPGEMMAYSNAGYAILGHIAERLGKKSFSQLMKERIFDPLEMKSAICGYPGESGMPSGSGQPHGHFDMKEGPRPGKIGGDLTNLTAPAGGGVACSADDLAKFGTWHLRGFLGEKVAILKSETIKRLHTPLPRAAGLERYAAGWVIEGEMHGHNGSDGTFNAELALFPKDKLVVVGIVNMGFEKDPTPGQEAIRAVLKRGRG